MTATLQNRATTQSYDGFVSLGYTVAGGFNDTQIDEWASSNNIVDKVVKIPMKGLACNGKTRFEIKVHKSVLRDLKVSRPPQLPIAC